MTQPTQRKTLDCNTNNNSRVRSRTWCFTLNNYMEAEILNLQSDSYEYCFQKEIGSETGTPHLQGVIKFKNAVRFSTVKKLNGRAHWEVCKNWNASLKYCSKKETNDGELYTNIKSLLNNDTLTQVKIKKPEENFEEMKQKALEEIMNNAFKNISEEMWKKLMPYNNPINDMSEAEKKYHNLN